MLDENRASMGPEILSSAGAGVLRKVPGKVEFCLHFKVVQGAAKGGRQKESDHFFFFSFGHFLVTFADAFVTLFVTLLPNSFCQTPFAARRIMLVDSRNVRQGIQHCLVKVVFFRVY